MILLVKRVIAIFVICTCAALPFDDGSPWKRLFDDQETEGLLDFAENDPKKCCQYKGYIYTDLPGTKKCLRKLKVVSCCKFGRQYAKYLNGTTHFLGGDLILHRGILYESRCPPRECTYI